VAAWEFPVGGGLAQGEIPGVVVACATRHLRYVAVRCVSHVSASCISASRLRINLRTVTSALAVTAHSDVGQVAESVEPTSTT
jgi:hypothetical protein